MDGMLKQLTVVSGKGGTGKTTVLASFAALGDSQVLADCDVGAANLHLVLIPTVVESGDFYGAKIAMRAGEPGDGAAKSEAGGSCAPGGRCRSDSDGRR